jgi:hypothetical protein
VLRNAQIILSVFAASVLIAIGVVSLVVINKTSSASAPLGPARGTGPSSTSGLTPGFLGVSENILALIIGSVLLTMFGVGLVIQRTAVLTARTTWANRTDDQAAINALSQQFLQQRIVRGALIEGPGLLAVVVLLLSGSWIMLVPAALCVILLVLTIPRSDHLASYIEAATGGPQRS